ncbi:hypothetical protein PRIPAC_96226 [Pristionchus pacificus]|uniref:Uncharacterized protein n=1 Tax=Pristionchus pacificus TaxID=54126 RepID=A0A2A6BC41_PRIPA|nr:hypothetical protein PRIPAC_96226 [Pristionchus pacificus]|eukprot:PDM63411.1 hypothetical protein PRIPAC_53768 [Pristionchus pacificus]
MSIIMRMTSMDHQKEDPGRILIGTSPTHEDYFVSLLLTTQVRTSAIYQLIATDNRQQKAKEKA